MFRVAAACLILLLVGCNDTDHQNLDSVRIKVAEAPAVTRPAGAAMVQPALTPSVEEKVGLLLDIVGQNSLRNLARQADAEPAFVSNFANQAHRLHWDLLRRTGFDPLAQLARLLEGPYGTRRVGEEIWFIWPDLAALEPDELLPERLDFTNRARLQDLVGEAGISRIRNGQPYPGLRTAIAGDGRWLYYLHQTEDEAGG